MKKAKCPDAVDIQSKLDAIYDTTIYVYVIFDIFLASLFLIYYKRREIRDGKQSWLYYVSGGLFAIAIAFGYFEVKSAANLRDSKLGKVCFGDHLKTADYENEGIYTKYNEYFMTSEGFSVTFM